jgi:hypothetical protein
MLRGGNSSATDKSEWLNLRPGSFTPGVTATIMHGTGGSIESPTSYLDAEKKNNRCPCRETNPGSTVEKRLV